jgi:hypothetical protein
MQSQAEATTVVRLRPRGLWDGMGPRGRGSRSIAPRVEQGFGALAEAFEETAVRTSGSTLMDSLLDRERAIPIAVTMHALRSLVGLACRQTGETPRALLEAEIGQVPPDDFWRAEIKIDPVAHARPGRD